MRIKLLLTNALILNTKLITLDVRILWFKCVSMDLPPSASFAHGVKYFFVVCVYDSSTEWLLKEDGNV